MKFEIYFAF